MTDALNHLAEHGPLRGTTWRLWSETKKREEAGTRHAARKRHERFAHSTRDVRQGPGAPRVANGVQSGRGQPRHWLTPHIVPRMCPPQFCTRTTEESGPKTEQVPTPIT